METDETAAEASAEAAQQTEKPSTVPLSALEAERAKRQELAQRLAALEAAEQERAQRLADAERSAEEKLAEREQRLADLAAEREKLAAESASWREAFEAENADRSKSLPKHLRDLVPEGLDPRAAREQIRRLEKLAADAEPLATGTRTRGSTKELPTLSEQDRKDAERMGMSEEKYAELILVPRMRVQKRGQPAQ